MPDKQFASQGLVNSRDQSLLKAGELAQADDCYYKPGNPALSIVPGRTLYNSTPESGTITGIRFLGFDTAADIVAIFVPSVAGGGFRRGPATATGAFVDIITGIGTGFPSGSFDSIYYNGTHTLINGSTRGIVVDSTYATRLLGMLVNTTAPTVNTATGAGTGFSISPGKGMTYWIEERVKVGSVIIKRNISSAATCTTVTNPTAAAVTWKPRISKPVATVNSDASHWAVFATATLVPAVGSPITNAQGFPIGAEIGEALIGTAFIDDLRTGTDPGFPTGPIYETAAVNISGFYTVVPRNAPPPIPSTGDVLEESFVLDNLTDRSLIRYSWPEVIDAYPAVNFIKFAEKEQDEVRVIRKVGDVIVVLLRDTAWRIDYLPRPEDAEFNRGRCRSIIPGAPGVVNNVQSAAVFSMGNKYFLAYVSPVGLMITDGFSQNLLTGDLDWPAMVNLSQLDKATLKNNDAKFQLEIRYPSFGSSVNDKIILVNYHPTHLKDSSTGSQGSVTGPVARPSTAASDALISNQSGMYSAQGTSMYVEWLGTTDPATGVPILATIKLGDMYLSGLGKQARTTRVWIHHSAGTSTITGTLTKKNENQSDETHTWTVPSSVRQANSWMVDGLAEAFVVGAQISAATTEQAINYFVLDGDESGDAKD